MRFMQMLHLSLDRLRFQSDKVARTNDLFIRLDCVIVIFRRLSDTDAAKSTKKMLKVVERPFFV